MFHVKQSNERNVHLTMFHVKHGEQISVHKVSCETCKSRLSEFMFHVKRYFTPSGSLLAVPGLRGSLMLG